MIGRVRAGVVVWLVAVLAALPPMSARAEVVDRLVAVVGGQPLLASQVAIDAELTAYDPASLPFWRMTVTAGARAESADPDTERAIDALIVRGVASDVALYQPTREQLDERIASIRSAFGPEDAETEQSWRMFLVERGLDGERLEVVVRRRMVVERFLMRNLMLRPSDPGWTEACAAMLEQLRPRVRVRRIAATPSP